MRKTGAWDQIDPDGTGPTLIRPRRPTPGDIKAKNTLDRNQPQMIRESLVPIAEHAIEDTQISDLKSADKRF
jgi:hypothetical protein